MRLTRLERIEDTKKRSITSRFQNFTVSNDNICHLVFDFNVKNTTVSGIGYVQKRNEVRKKDSFSPLFPIVDDNTQRRMFSSPDIAHDDQGNAYIVCQEMIQSTIPTVPPEENIVLRIVSPSGVSGPNPIAKGGRYPRAGGYSLRSYHLPKIIVKEKTIHFAFFGVEDNFDSNNNWVSSEYSIFYTEEKRKRLEKAFSFVITPITQIFPSFDGPLVLRVGSDQKPQILFLYYDGVGILPHLSHLKKDTTRFQSKWTVLPETIAQINTPILISPENSYDFELGPNNDEHYSYVHMTGSAGNAHIHVYYRGKKNGILERQEQVSTTELSESHCWTSIVINSRNIPEIIYAFFVRKVPVQLNVAYATRQENPVDPNDPWSGRQEPIPDIQWENQDYLLGDDKCVIKTRIQNDVVHFITVTADGTLYSRQYEPNLGIQDPYGTIPWAVGSSVNITTGNIHFPFTLFSSNGIGFSSELSLVYNSLNIEPSEVSQGWRTDYSVTLTDHQTHLIDNDENKDYITVQFGDGRFIVYKLKENLIPLGIALIPVKYHVAEDEFGDYSYILKNSTIQNVGPYPYILITKHGTKFCFNLDGRLEVIADTQKKPNKLSFIYGPPGDDTVTPPIVSKLTKNMLGVQANVVTQINDSSNRPTKLKYDEKNKLRKIIDPESNYELEYVNGKLNKIIFSSQQDLTWKFEYYTNNNLQNYEKLNLLSKIYTPSSGTKFWQNFFRPDGRAIRIAEPQALHVDESGNKVTESTSMQINYDVTSKFRNLGAVLLNKRNFDTKFEFLYRYALVNRIEFKDNSFIERKYFDKTRNIQSHKNRHGSEITYSYYDAAVPVHVKNNIERISYPNYSPEFPEVVNGTIFEEYHYGADGRNNVVSFKDPKNNETILSYDGPNVEYIKFPPTYISKWNVDEMKLSAKLSSTGLKETKLKILHAQNGASLAFMPPRGFENGVQNPPENTYATSFSDFDPQTGLAQTITEPEHEPHQLSFTKMGQTNTHTFPGGGTATNEYDGLHRNTSVVEPSGDFSNPKSRVNFIDLQNKIELYNQANEKDTYEYDILGRLIKTTDNNQKSIYYFYDKEGNRCLIENNNHQLIKRNEWNFENRIEKVTIMADHLSSRTVTKFEYKKGLLWRKTIFKDPNSNTPNSATDFITEYKRDVRGDIYLEINSA